MAEPASVVLGIAMDGLRGMMEAIEAAYPKPSFSSTFLGWYSLMIAWAIAMLAVFLLFLFDAIISVLIILSFFLLEYRTLQQK